MGGEANLGHNAVVVAEVVVTPVEAAVPHVTVFEHVVEVQLVVVEVSPKFVTAQSTCQLLTVMLAVQLLVEVLDDVLVGSDLGGLDASWPGGGSSTTGGGAEESGQSPAI